MAIPKMRKSVYLTAEEIIFVDDAAEENKFSFSEYVAHLIREDMIYTDQELKHEAWLEYQKEKNAPKPFTEQSQLSLEDMYQLGPNHWSEAIRVQLLEAGYDIQVSDNTSTTVSDVQKN